MVFVGGDVQHYWLSHVLWRPLVGYFRMAAMGMGAAVIVLRTAQLARLERQSPRRFVFVSASLDRRSEDVHVLPIVVTELEFGDIERHIFAAHFVECADHAALEDRPEAFDGLCMNCANDILAFGVVNDAMRIFTVEALVATP